VGQKDLNLLGVRRRKVQVLLVPKVRKWVRWAAGKKEWGLSPKGNARPWPLVRCARKFPRSTKTLGKEKGKKEP